jgi:DNA repair ATPase RecN
MSYSPIKTLRIKNFQSLEDITIDLGPLTVLVGQGDVGKSAVLRALRAACLNDGNDDDIRHGSKRCTVDLIFADGVNITWWKDKGKGGCYGFHSEDEYTEYLKTGGQVPDAIAEYLGIGLIKVDATTELTPQLSDQFDAPFIVCETGSKRARILGKATRLDVVVSAQMQCKKELDAAKRGAAEAATGLAGVEGSLAALPDYEAIEAEVGQAETNLETLADSILLAGRLQELADQMAEVSSRATAIDVAPLQAQLREAGEKLDTAERVQLLAQKIPDMTRTAEGFVKRRADHQEAIESFQAQLVSACEEAGACVECGGLLSHKECAG